MIKLTQILSECCCDGTIKEEDPCWDGYKQVGTKTKNGKQVPNCVPEAITYHTDNKVPFHENVFRMYSENYFRFFQEARSLFESGDLTELHWFDEELLRSDIGTIGEYNGRLVPLDIPIAEGMIKEAEYQGRDVQLNKPKRGGSKKFYVYVKDPKSGNIRKVSFGVAGGGGKLAVKLKDPDARRSFAARHQCEKKKDKTSPGYWSCRLPRFAKSLGLSAPKGAQWW